MTAAVCLACARARPSEIDSCNPPGRSAIAWEIVPSDQPIVRGRVVQIDSLTPIPNVTLLVGTPGKATPVAPDGTFRVSLDSAGSVAIDVLRVGFMRIRTTVEVPPRGAVVLVAALERRNLVLDGCSSGVTTAPVGTHR
jgi:hypothetical protein